MSKKNTNTQEVRNPVETKPEIVELSFEAMETLSGAAGKCWAKAD
ncbi:MAG: hypothetical protein ACYT04_43240 [Nostoc sp.]